MGHAGVRPRARRLPSTDAPHARSAFGRRIVRDHRLPQRPRPPGSRRRGRWRGRGGTADAAAAPLSLTRPHRPRPRTRGAERSAHRSGACDLARLPGAHVAHDWRRDGTADARAARRWRGCDDFSRRAVVRPSPPRPSLPRCCRLWLHRAPAGVGKGMSVCVFGGRV